MIVQVVSELSIVKDSLTRYTLIPLLRASCRRGRNLLWHIRSKRKRTEVISDTLSQPRYYIVNGDCLHRNAARLLGNRPMKIWHGNGASVVVRAGESPVHKVLSLSKYGEGKQLIILIQLTENV
jgi:hypothetical protein